MDSPRGRIQLMEKTARRHAPLSPTVVEHFDRCLGCMACVLELPFGRAVRPADRGDARDVVETEHRAPARPSGCSGGSCSRRSRTRDGCAGRCGSRRSAGALPAPRWARPMLELAPPLALRRAAAGGDTCSCVIDTSAARVGLLTGCVQSVVFGDVNAATARVLAAAGYEVVAPPQGCCGALSAHAGRADESARFTRAAAPRASTASTRSSSTPPAAART